MSTDKALASEVGAKFISKNQLHGLKKEHWNYVLIDCPPIVGIISLNALTAPKKAVCVHDIGKK